MVTKYQITMEVEIDDEVARYVKDSHLADNVKMILEKVKGIKVNKIKATETDATGVTPTSTLIISK